MKYILLLTGCINPNGMPFTSLTDNSVRKEQYIKAINYYIHNTDFPIVFVENSNTDISNIFKPVISSNRIEVLTFCGNNNKNKGKGYGEAEIIEYALNNSQFITLSNRRCAVVKITGRLIVENLKDIINKHFIFQTHNSIVVSYNTAFTLADSRVIIAPLNFYISFLENKEQINDSNKKYFESVLSDSIKRSKNFHYYPFFVEPQITGQSGSTGEEYFPYKENIKRRIIYLIHSTTLLLRYNKLNVNNKIDSLQKSIYTVFLLCLKITNKILL